MYIVLFDIVSMFTSTIIIMQMIQINERVHAGCPVIIEGETGVGKTFLIEMVAGFWNLHVMRRWKRVQNRLKKKVDKLRSKNSQSEWSYFETLVI